jgi:hypothetical protein
MNVDGPQRAGLVTTTSATRKGPVVRVFFERCTKRSDGSETTVTQTVEIPVTAAELQGVGLITTRVIRPPKPVPSPTLSP